MKLHRHLAQAVVQAVPQIFDPERGRYADKVIEYHLRNHKKWGARDRRFFAESVYDVVRWWRLLWAAVGREPNLNEASLWQVLGVWLVKKDIEFPDWPELKAVDAVKVRAFLSRSDLPRAIRESIPDWLDEVGAAELGARWPALLSALNTQASVVLRANSLKTTAADLRQRLQTEGVDAREVPGFESALVLPERKNVFKTESFKLGLFEVQDLASQAVAPFLAPKPGERVIDACAGAGGKTLHLAALMKNKGRILSMDVEARKLDELRTRAARDGVDIAETRVIESMKTVKRLENGADRLLLDVPCSGLGVLRRNPDSKWKTSPKQLESINSLQREILSAYPRMVKPGGVLVYSTCSLLPSENERQVEWFLSQNSGWTLEDQKHFWPDEGFDGFYMARLRRATGS
ncbi:MAG TPA: class I SAM-dependent methyltransferase [Bdellovibrionales bacterium]|nr:class I SAM-dependent methyltransferase [Bdellovibrionales bacterium]